MPVLPSSTFDTSELRKARGPFFTPKPVARYITAWAVRSVEDRVLEPSCGEASFLLAAVDCFALRVVAGSSRPDGVVVGRGALDGVELRPA